jgi:prolyl oligopeptidase
MAFWLKTSPYQKLKAGVAYPEPFIFTTIAVCLRSAPAP